MYDVLYCAYRLGMPWRQYLDEHDLLDHWVWWEWHKLHEWDEPRWKGKDPYECIVGDGPDAHVPTATYERWKVKHAGARFAVQNADAILMKFAKEGDQEAINRLKAKGIRW